MTLPRSPAELHQALATAYNKGDVEGLVALFEPDATLVPQPGTYVRGTTDIRNALNTFLAIGGSMKVETVHVVEAADCALTRTAWTISNGDQVAARANGSEVLRKQADGSWRFVVDHPFGAELSA